MRQYFRLLIEHWAILGFGLLTVFWGNFGQSFFISWFGASIQASLDLTATTYGSAYSAATLGSGLMLMVAGGWVDRVTPGRFAALASLGLMAATVMLSLADSYLWLALGFFLLRLSGQGLLPHTAITTVARHFHANRGKAISVVTCGVPLGEVILPIFAVAAITALGWQLSWLLVAASIPLFYLPLIFWLLRRAGSLPGERDIPATTATVTVRSVGRREMLADPRFWLALPALLAGPFIVTGIFIHQGFVLSQKAWTPEWFASCFVVYGVTHWIGSLLAGALVDRFTATRVLLYCQLPLMLAMLCGAVLSGSWSAVLLMMLLGTAMGAGSPVTGALWAEIYGTANLGAIRSLITALMVLSTAASPLLFGWLIDRGMTVSQLFFSLALYCCLAIGLLWFSYRPAVDSYSAKVEVE